MSGFVAIVNKDGGPVDEQLLRRMTESMRFRGPDAQQTWISGSVGLGHTMLRTTFEAERERQPCSLDGQVWIAADARVDTRGDLIRELEQHGGIVEKDVTDPELILHAYHAWGEDCVHHLLGDFAFAIWDGRQRKLFCARDHLGIKPFFYSDRPGCVIVSNTLQCVRAHPAVAAELNEQALGDYLLFNYNADVATTTFLQINRLAPAQRLRIQDGVLRTERYWTLETSDEIRYRRPAEYVEHFHAVMAAAVADRLRSPRAGVFMSGGLDSPTVASFAAQALGPARVHAYTNFFERLIPDDEPHYASIIARRLSIEIQFQAWDPYTLFERWECPRIRPPEPYNDPLSAFFFDARTAVTSWSPVALGGEGGDPALTPSASRILRDLASRRSIRTVGAVAGYWACHRKIPRLGLRSHFRTQLDSTAGLPPYPRWLNQDFEKRLNLRARWRQFHSREGGAKSAVRAEACEMILHSYWRRDLETLDSGWTGVALEIRQPFFDLRVLEYLLRLPSVPWCVDKHLLRRAMAPALSAEVVRRPKTPLQGDPLGAALRAPGAEWVDNFRPVPQLCEYVCREAIPRMTGTANQSEYNPWVDLKPLSLNLWLQDGRN